MAKCQGIETGIDLRQLMDAGHRLEELMGHPGDSYVLRAGTNEDIRLKMPDR
jgi:hydroxymethylglutaryl-CoA lyase